MTTVAAVITGSVVPDSQLAQLICPGIGTLVLPWWPTDVEHSGWAPAYAETARPGRTVSLTRSDEPLPSMRLGFTLRTSSVTESIQSLLDMVRTLAAAKPVVQLMLGPSDRGRWRITEAGATETDWAANGEASVADVIVALRRESDAAIVVGPIKKTGKR